MLIKPYGERPDDGAIQMSFTLPVVGVKLGRLAAERLCQEMGLAADVHATLGKVGTTSYLPESVEIDDLDWLAAIVECRYKSINKKLHDLGHKAIVEIGSGYSLRFLDFADDGRAFIDTDLNEITAFKIKYFSKYSDGSVNFSPLNVISENILDIVDRHIPTSIPVGIVCEGLFQYFNREEMRKACANIHEALSVMGGTWITPDFSTTDQYNRYYEYSPIMEKIVKFRSETTRRDVGNMGFESVDHIEEFFTASGFDVSRTPMLLSEEAITSCNLEKYREVKEFFDPYLNIWTLTAH